MHGGGNGPVAAFCSAIGRGRVRRPGAGLRRARAVRRRRRPGGGLPGVRDRRPGRLGRRDRLVDHHRVPQGRGLGGQPGGRATVDAGRRPPDRPAATEIVGRHRLNGVQGKPPSAAARPAHRSLDRPKHGQRADFGGGATQSAGNSSFAGVTFPGRTASAKVVSATDVGERTSSRDSRCATSPPRRSCRRRCSRSVRARSRRSSSSPPPNSGASPAMAALVVATAGLGQIAADIPAGTIVHRFGERPTMIGAAGLTILALLGCIFAPNLAVFAFAIFLTGSGTAVWLLARQAYVTEVVPYRLRATAMSTLGGVFRIGLFIGPFIGAAVVHFTGLWGAYAVHIVAAVVAAGVLLMVKDLSTGGTMEAATKADQDGQGTGRPGGPGAAVGVRDAGRRRPGGQRDPGRPAGGAAAVGPAPRAVAHRDLGDLRHLRRHRHVAVLPGRQGDGPVRPGLGGHSVDGRARHRRCSWCRSPRRPPGCCWSAC